MNKTDRNRQDKQCLVLYYLLGKDRNGWRRTQTEVLKVMDISKGGLSQTVNYLLESKIISKATRGNRDVLYDEGPRYGMLSEQVSDIPNRIVQGRSGATLEPGIQPDVRPYYDVHLSGKKVIAEVV